MATKYISVINLQNEDLTIKDAEARNQISNLNIGTLKSDVSALKTDVSTLKSDNTTNKSDISTLKTDNATNKSNITKLQQEVVKVTYDSTTEKMTIKTGE